MHLIMALQLSLEEKIEIVRISGDNYHSEREVARIFNQRHPNRQPIGRSTVGKINKIFKETGAVSKYILKHNRQRRNLNDRAVLDYFTNHPKNSLRIASLDLNLPRESIRRCLKRNKVRPFKPKFLQTLKEGDEVKRMEFCLWAQGEYLSKRNFLNHIMFSDEASFSTNGVVSSQNARYWASENPDWVINCKSQYSEKVNVWCGVLKDRLIGPYFFDGNMNGENFLEFLNNQLSEEIDEIPLAERENLHFQLDGCSVHNSRIVKQWLNDQFRNRWIGRGSDLIEWPPRSPDLTILDFFLWGILTQKVYKIRQRNRAELIQRIRQACAEITPQQIKNAVKNIRKRYDKCIELNGGLVEATNI